MNDQRQREKALDITQSYIVQAPAGAGKTELLTQRYLKLLSACTNPENVIAMTFTKKAVSELKTRVIESLQSTSDKRPEEAHKQTTYDLACTVMSRSIQNNWQILTTPSRLKISTIDGLSSLITSRYPTKSQLVPKQIISQNWERNKVYRQAAEQTLLAIDDAEYKDIIQPLLLYLDNNVERFYSLIVSMLEKRDQWLPKLYRHNSIDTKVLQDSAKSIISQHLGLLKIAADDCLDRRFFELLSCNTKPEYAQIQNTPGVEPESLIFWKNLRSICLTTENKLRKSINKNNGFPAELKVQKQEFIDILNTLADKSGFVELLANVELLPDVDFSNKHTETLQNIAAVLKLAVAQLNVLFEDGQTHDFIQVALDADKALDTQSEYGASDVALFLDYKIEHILIDEFQDTSVYQFGLIEKLISKWQANDGKTLFLVGDPMQSIYRFRQSQVGLFLQVKRYGIADIKPISIQLTTNFRSSKSIVEGNNEIFDSIFPAEEDVYKGAIVYSHSIANADDKYNNAIKFYPFAEKQYESEARQVVDIIKSSINNSSMDEVAVLVRNRSHLLDIVIALKQNNIEFEALKTSALKDNMFTRDLMSLTKALLNLGDKLSWLSILRAPWCGLLLDDLLVLSQDDSVTIFDQLNDKKVLQKLSDDGKTRALHIVGSLIDVINNQSRFGFVELLTCAIDRLLPKQSLSVQNTMIKEMFLGIIDNCESREMLNVETIESMLDELYAPSKKAKIKLMTIHESKGLEFDEVIIPGLGRAPQNNKPPIIHMQEFADQSLLMAPIKSCTASNESNTYNYLKYIESQQDAFEIMRLLYVAMTRAKKKIHLLGSVNKQKNAHSKTFLKLLLPKYRHKFDNVEDPIVNNKSERIASKLLRHAKLLTSDSIIDNNSEKIDYQLSTDVLFKSLLGTLLHQYYELGELSPDRSSIESKLVSMGFGDTDIVESIDFIIGMLDNTYQDTKFEWLFKTRVSTQVEAEFITENGNIVVDRLFIDDDTLWIIDFKTAVKADDESLERFVNRQKHKHAEQLLSYKEVLSKIYSNEIKCALYCPAVQELIEIV